MIKIRPNYNPLLLEMQAFPVFGFEKSELNKALRFCRVYRVHTDVKKKELLLAVQFCPQRLLFVETLENHRIAICFEELRALTSLGQGCLNEQYWFNSSLTCLNIMM